MKKFLLAAALIVGVVVSQLVAMSRASAEDVYVGNWEGGWKAYLLSDSIDYKLNTGNGFYLTCYCQIKAVSPKNTVKILDYVFESFNDSNGKMAGATFRDSTGASGRFYIGQPGEYEIEHTVFKMLRYYVKNQMNS